MAAARDQVSVHRAQGHMRKEWELIEKGIADEEDLSLVVLRPAQSPQWLTYKMVVKMGLYV
ncbi:hypothetical protein NQZ68_016280 [Dissostichus eleginoides]|nr:hypothetical protein NQZ68_016280 [Dissostichus eleginoides]